MAEPAKKIKPRPTSKSGSESSVDILEKRQSKELVIGFCGAVGAGIKRVKAPLKKQLEAYGYKVHDIRISELLKEVVPQNYPRIEYLKDLSPTARYTELQALGNFLGKKEVPLFLPN